LTGGRIAERTLEQHPETALDVVEGAGRSEEQGDTSRTVSVLTAITIEAKAEEQRTGRRELGPGSIERSTA